MKNLILITGDLAAGKSTLAYSLGDYLSYLVITKDELKEIACDVFSYTNREENKKLSKVAMDNMIYIFKQNAMVGNDIILDANFRSEEVCEIAEIAAEHEYNVILFRIIGDLHLLYERFLERMEHRHRAHMSIGLQNDFSLYEEYNMNLRNQDLVYEGHEIDVTYLDEEGVRDRAIEILSQEHMI